VVTQGFSGKLTHRGSWRHALDFEAPGGAGSWDAGSGDLREFAIFGTPVLSPVAGTVVAVENGLADNPAGGNNPEHNWGNHVILRADAGFHVMLAHFQQGSVKVAPWQRVEAAAVLGHCGNSGRSPVPHLHVHVQHGPLRGAPTVPWVLKHFIAPDPETGREYYHLSGVPEQGTLVRQAEPSPALYACLTGWLPGRRTFSCAATGAEETLVMDFDETGRFRLKSSACGGRLSLFLAEGVLYAQPFTGGAAGVLALLGILLARVPCIDEPVVSWRDVVAAAPFLGRAKRVLHDVCDPFLGPEILHYEYTALATGEQTFEIATRLAPGDLKLAATVPRILRGMIGGRDGVTEISGETCGGVKFRWTSLPSSPSRF
jgi:hypothetical protein